MPGMPRLNKETTKIAYAIKGIPENLRMKRSKEQEKINKRLLFEETQRVR